MTHVLNHRVHGSLGSSEYIYMETPCGTEKINKNCSLSHNNHEFRRPCYSLLIPNNDTSYTFSFC